MISAILTRLTGGRQETHERRRRYGRRLRRHVPYFLTPRSARASFALAIDSECLPPSCSFCASSSFATAPFTFGSSAFILAAASRPSLMIFGQELAIAAPAVNTRLTATAIATIAFFIRCHH